MPRPRGSTKTPSYCLHKPSGRAYVNVGGRVVYLGRYGSAESRAAYDRVIGEWLVAGRAAPAPAPTTAAPPPPSGLTVSVLIAAFWEHAKTCYPAPPCADGRRPKGELGNFRDVLKPLRRSYGPTPAAEFGPRALRAMRSELVRLGWCRNVINRQVSRIRHVFKWGVGAELLPPHQYQGLLAVEGLRQGHGSVRESAPVRPVPDAAVDAVRPYVSRQVWAMIELQRLTGMRPGEVCSIRWGDIDTSGSNWVYQPLSHKTAHHGHARKILMGPRAQQILAPWRKADPLAFIFSPTHAEAERRAVKRSARKTPVTPSQQLRARKAARSRRSRAPKDCYTPTSYRRSIARGCQRASPPGNSLSREERNLWRVQHVWHPHQLRHSAATRIRRVFGIDAAQVILGHRSLSTTQVYAEQDHQKADSVMTRVG